MWHERSDDARGFFVDGSESTYVTRMYVEQNQLPYIMGKVVIVWKHHWSCYEYHSFYV